MGEELVLQWPDQVATLRRIHEEKKQSPARVDALTGVYSYSTFYELLEAEIARSERHLRPLSVLMIELGDLKAPHDTRRVEPAATFGHPAGDAVLKEVARLLKNFVRNGDVVARYGEDGFTVMLVETNKVDAVSTANRLCRMVEETSFEHHGILPHKALTINIGVAAYPTDAGKKVELVAKAEQALCEARRLGSNLVRTVEQGQDLTPTRVYREKRLYFRCKRGLDIILSLLLLIITLPLCLFIALLIKLDSPGPVIFTQGRVGLRRRSRGMRGEWEIGTFNCYKFRTMYYHAGQGPHYASIKAFAEGELASDGEAMFKLTDDPRVTRVGKVLRKTTLDELPQLFNVLRGEMSMVGPRPVPLYEVAEYNEWQRERLTVLPGIVGLWQVKGRSSVSFDEMARMDIEYIHNQSLWFDLKILLLAIPAVLSSKGAV